MVAGTFWLYFAKHEMDAVEPSPHFALALTHWLFHPPNSGYVFTPESLLSTAPGNSMGCCDLKGLLLAKLWDQSPRLHPSTGRLGMSDECIATTSKRSRVREAGQLL